MNKRIGVNGRMRLPGVRESTAKPARKSTLKPGRFILAMLLVLGVIATAVSMLPSIKSIVNRAHQSLSHLHLPRLPEIELGRKNTSSITAIAVIGCNVLDSATVVSIAGVAAACVCGDVVPRNAEQKLLASPWVDKARVVVGGDGRIRISIDERIPKAFFVRGNGELCFTDMKGNIWPVCGGRTWDIPLVSGLADSIVGSGVQLTTVSRNRLGAFFKQITLFEKEIDQKVVQADFVVDGEVTVRFESLSAPVSFTEKTMSRRFAHLLAILDRAVAGDSSALSLKSINLCYGSIAFAQQSSMPLPAKVDGFVDTATVVDSVGVQ